jgi:phosphoglycerate dehydrogenase-like enzyme
MTPRVRWVHSCSAGLDGALFPALRDSPVLLTSGRGVFSDALGEFVIGAVLFFAKQFRRMVRGQEAGVWDQFDTMMIAGRTMGIVGYGDIGHAAAKRAHALGMKVLSVRRRPQLSQGDALVDEVMGPDRLGELVARSDYIVVTAPLTPETRGLIGDAEFGAMKPETVIINVGRGPVIDEVALIHALQAKRIRGAALDVFHSEPLPADHPFYRLDNVLLSPHCADRTADWREQAMRLFLDNFGRFRRGEPLLNLVDKRLGY